MTMDIRAIVIKALDNAVGVMNMPDIARRLMAGHDLAFDAIEIDSLSFLEMVMQIEDALGVELDADEVAAAGSIDGLVACLQTRVAGRKAAG